MSQHVIPGPTQDIQKSLGVTYCNDLFSRITHRTKKNENDISEHFLVYQRIKNMASTLMAFTVFTPLMVKIQNSKVVSVFFIHPTTQLLENIVPKIDFQHICQPDTVLNYNLIKAMRCCHAIHKTKFFIGVKQYLHYLLCARLCTV